MDAPLKSMQLIFINLEMFSLHLPQIPGVPTQRSIEEVWSLTELLENDKKSERNFKYQLVNYALGIAYPKKIVTRLISMESPRVGDSPEGQPICCRSTACTGFIGWADTMAGSKTWPSNSSMES